MDKEFSLTINTTFDELAELSSQAHQFLEAAEIPADAVYKLDLALEEMVTNVIKYGYSPPAPDNQVGVTIALNKKEVELTIEDSGHEFNPLEAIKPDTHDDISHRQVGGVGIHLTRNMTDEMIYHRLKDKNIMVIKVNH